MRACVPYVPPLFGDPYQTRISRDFWSVWDSSQLTPLTVLHSVSATPTPVVPSRTGIAHVPAWLHGVDELARAVPAKFASGNVVIVFFPPKLPAVPPVHTSEKAPPAVV